MKLRNTLIIAVMLLLTSCSQQGCSTFSQQLSFYDRKYNVKVYEGGKLVRNDTFRGKISQDKVSGGIYYTKGDSLIEVSSSYVITSAP